jgi:hypothetical protein
MPEPAAFVCQTGGRNPDALRFRLLRIVERAEMHYGSIVEGPERKKQIHENNFNPR